MKNLAFAILLIISVGVASKIIFEDDFNTLDFHKWKHDITLSGGGNW